MEAESPTVAPTVRWLRCGVIATLIVALALFAIDLWRRGSPANWSAMALAAGLVCISILLLGAVCEGILRLPWRGAKPFLFALTVIPAVGGLASIALPEGLMHFFLNPADSTGYSPGRGLRLISVLTVPLAGAVALMVAVSFDSRWSRVLPTVALAVLLTVATRELAVSSFHGGWCPEAWAFEGETRAFPACTGLLEEGSWAPVEY